MLEFLRRGVNFHVLQEAGRGGEGAMICENLQFGESPDRCCHRRLAARRRGRYKRAAQPSALQLVSVANVDGALIGGASPTAKDFTGIAGVYR